MKPTTEVILFDLGGVLVGLGDDPIPSDWLPGDNRFDLSDWFSSETAISFEKGLISPRRFAETLKKDLKIEASPESIIQHFTSWPIGLYPGVHELLRSIENNFRLAVLSNTNELHWPRITNEFEIAKYFEHFFASHRLQKAKPDFEIFEHVVSELKVEPEKILFLDDNQNNVTVSKKLGIHGFHASGIKQVQQILSDVGAIDA
jgi:HAD superfamily hydrolase (TIGR01509 family)